MTTAVADETANAAAEQPKAKKQWNQTPQQKEAATLRRDAALLEKYADSTLEPSVLKEKAKLMRAQADKLAPAQVKAEKVNGLTEQEWEKVMSYIADDFRARIVFAKGVGGFSLRQLKAIANRQ